MSIAETLNQITEALAIDVTDLGSPSEMLSTMVECNHPHILSLYFNYDKRLKLRSDYSPSLYRGKLKKADEKKQFNSACQLAHYNSSKESIIKLPSGKLYSVSAYGYSSARLINFDKALEIVSSYYQ